MTIYQQAHERIDQFPEETVYLFIQLMDKMTVASDKNTSRNKKKFLESAGKIDIDTDAISYLREASII